MKENEIYYEMRTQEHEMWIEGTVNYKISKNKIKEIAKKHNYIVKDIEVDFDNFQHIYRFDGDLIKESQNEK